MVRAFTVLEAGVAPATNSLGNCCSIQLSYPSLLKIYAYISHKSSIFTR